MRRLLIIGCGNIGLRVVYQIQQQFQAYQCYALSHTPERFEQLTQAGIVPITGNLDHYSSLKQLIRLIPLFNHIIHLAPPPKLGIHDTRTQNLIQAIQRGRCHCHYRNRHRSLYCNPHLNKGLAKPLTLGYFQTKQAVYYSKFKQLTHIQAKKPLFLPKIKLVYISTTGVYGHRHGIWLDETSTVQPQTPRAQRRISAEKQLRSWAKKSYRNVGVSILRVPGIYSLENLPLARLQAGTPILLAKEDHYTNRIHADDLASVILCALAKGRPQRIINATDGQPSLIGDMFDALADWANLPRLPRITKKEYEQTIAPLNPMAWSFMQESRRISNARLLSEYRYCFRYFNYYDFLSKQKKEG